MRRSIQDCVNVQVQKKVGVFFIHVPKNAGTFITKQLYNKQLRHYTIRYYIDIDPELLNNYRFFSIVRPPTDRFLSAYRFLAANGTADVGVNSEELPPRKALSSIEDLADWMSPKNPSVLHPALRPQCYYLEDYTGAIPKIDLYTQHNVDRALSVYKTKYSPSTAPDKGLNSTTKCSALPIDRALESFINRFYRSDLNLYDTVNATQHP